MAYMITSRRIRDTAKTGLHNLYSRVIMSFIPPTWYACHQQSTGLLVTDEIVSAAKYDGDFYLRKTSTTRELPPGARLAVDCC